MHFTPLNIHKNGNSSCLKKKVLLYVSDETKHNRYYDSCRLSFLICTFPDNNVQTTFNSTTNLYSNLGKIVQKHNGLCIAHINVRSIAASSKLQEVNLLLCNGCIDILGITETWLTESHSNAHIQIEGYNLERCDKKKASDELL